jgi:hypothetical protein
MFERSGVLNVKPSPSTATTSGTVSCKDGESDAKELLFIQQLTQPGIKGFQTLDSLSPIYVIPGWKSAFVLWSPYRPHNTSPIDSRKCVH